MQKKKILYYSNLSTPVKSRGRIYSEPLSSLRTPYQRDRDRVIHSTAFRRLKHKTQVFVNTEGDHYRTRITHSIEVAQIARSVAKYLNLNEDLTETLSLAHDLGHTPFGHAGEDALAECMDDYGGFDHNLQTLRIIMFLENKYFKFKGLNLSIETLEGLLKHNGPVEDTTVVANLIGLNVFKDKINFNTYPSLEAQISAISDDIAYNNHDIQDGINANLFKLEELVEIDFFKSIYIKYRKKINKRNYKIAIYQIIRDSIDLMIRDLLSNTKKNLKDLKITSMKDIAKSDQLIVCFSDKIQKSEKEIKLFLRTKMYNNKTVLKKNLKGKVIVKKLFSIIKSNPRKFLTKDQLTKDKFRAISDFISGMTDRYAINLYNNFK
jgi:dGTPase